MTSRGLVQKDFQQVAEFLHEVCEVAKEVQASHGKLLKDWIKGITGNQKLADIKRRVEEFSESFPMPGYEV